jgi:hypothetical protein
MWLERQRKVLQQKAQVVEITATLDKVVSCARKSLTKLGSFLVRTGDKANESFASVYGPRSIWGLLLLLLQTSSHPIPSHLHASQRHRQFIGFEVLVLAASVPRCATPATWRRLKVRASALIVPALVSLQIPQLSPPRSLPSLTTTQLCLLKLTRTSPKPPQSKSLQHRKYGVFYHRLVHGQRKFAAELGDTPVAKY